MSVFRNNSCTVETLSNGHVGTQTNVHCRVCPLLDILLLASYRITLHSAII